MVDWDCVCGYGSDSDNFSYENEIPGCLRDACDISEKTFNRDKKLTHKKIYCPICGLKMIEKKGKFGKFYGCVDFPYCKGSKKYIQDK